MILPNIKSVNHDMFYRRRKMELRKIFKSFKKSGLVSSFTFMQPLNGFTHVVQVRFTIHNQGNGITLRVFDSPSSSRLKLANQDSHNIEVLVGSEIRARQVSAFIEEQIQVKALGFKAENLFIEDVNKIAHFKARESLNEENEHQGIDCWVTFNSQEVPIQVKSSIAGYKKHKRKFPLVPLIIYEKDKFTKEELRKILISICNNYKKGIIEYVL